MRAKCSTFDRNVHVSMSMVNRVQYFFIKNLAGVTEPKLKSSGGINTRNPIRFCSGSEPITEVRRAQRSSKVDLSSNFHLST